MTTIIFLYFTIILTTSSALAKPYQNQSDGHVDYCEFFGCTKENADFYCPRLSCNGCVNLYWKHKNLCPCDVVCEPEKCTEEFRKKKCPIEGLSTCEDSYLEGKNVCTCTSKDHCKVYECDPENRKIQCDKLCGNGNSCYDFYVEGNFLCACTDEPLETWPDGPDRG